MKPKTANPASLLRCADAAGYAAVSFHEDEQRTDDRKSRRGFWRAFLALFFGRN